MTSLRFNAAWPWWVIMILMVAGMAIITAVYWREKRKQSTAGWVLLFLRLIGFVLVATLLTGPTFVRRETTGKLSRICVIVDTSESMGIGYPQGDGKHEGNPSQMDRVQDWLLGDAKSANSNEGWLNRMQARFQMELYTLSKSETQSSQLVWNSGKSRIERDALRPDSKASPLGSALRSVAESSPAAIVFITDGQSNQGPIASSAAETAKQRNIPIHVIAIGPSEEPNDLAIFRVEHTDRVLFDGQFRGSISVKESLPAGSQYRVMVVHEGRTVWSKEVQAENRGIRAIEFTLAAERLKQGNEPEPKSVYENTCVPVNLEVVVDSNAEEISLQNNRYATSLWKVTRHNRVLLLDQNGGWECRYIKNALHRDVSWDATIHLGRTAFEGPFFPSQKAKLFEYDLILITESTADRLSLDQLQWLSDYVAISGGGLIIIGRPVEDPESTNLNVLTELMPARRAKGAQTILPMQFLLPHAGSNQPAFQLSHAKEENSKQWNALRPPKSARNIELVAGAESLIELAVADPQNSVPARTVPFLASKLFGHGRVVYLGSDETWRWRFEVADLHHQRFWNQLVHWTMRLPFAVQGTYASLDTGPRMRTSNDSIEIRVKLKNASLQPFEGAALQANLVREGDRVDSVQLKPIKDLAGMYTAWLGPQSQGNYRVKLESPNVPQDALDIETEFFVRNPAREELNLLACNVSDLNAVAESTGGKLLVLDQAERVTSLLRPFQTEITRESQRSLWQSPFWFASIIGIFGLELLFRKRAGLR